MSFPRCLLQHVLNVHYKLC